ncbi:MAG: glycosyltransferase family 9 protein [Candidatus Eisenbacteria bacterium]|jgi:lipopolysaccharide heptosyltransferase II|nr:glycosyltransferase family 9 protein [Candidatus Eisenbacteria bacterium]
MPGLEQILLIRLGTITDVVAATAVLNGLREALPTAVVTMVVHKENEELLSGHPWVDRIVAYDRRKHHRGPLGFRRLLTTLREQDWSISIDLRRSVATRLMTRAAGAPTRLTASEESAVTSLLVSARINRFFARRTRVETLLGSLRKLGVGNGYRPPRLYLRPEWTSGAGNLLRQLGVKAPTVVGLGPGARRETKLWPPERYAELAKRLSCSGSEVLVLGSHEEKDICTKVAAGRAGVHDLAGRLSLGELLGLTARCTAFVGNDSGPTHCAHALGVPTVALFGPTDGRRYLFAGGRVIQRTVPCGPCSVRGRHRCPTGDHACMESISVDEVLQAVTQLLPAPKEPEATPSRW